MKFTFLDPLSKLISRSYCLCCQYSIERQTESCTDTNCFCQQYSIIANQDSLEKYSVRTHTPIVEQKTYMSSVHFIIHCTIIYIGQEEEMQSAHVRKYERAIKNEKPRETSRIVYARRRQTQKSTNTICIGHHTTQTNQQILYKTKLDTEHYY